MPKNITGHALLKNELCRKGVLAINIGVIDPGFEGPISSILINFGRGDFIVKQGGPFLRISFQRCPVSSKADKSSKYTREQYISNVRDEVAAYMASTFLNMEETTRKAAEKAFVSFKEGLVVWATLVAVLLGALAIFAPLGASYVEKYLARQEQQDLEQKVEKKVGELYDSRLKTLSDEVEKLKSQQKAGPGGESRRKTLGMSDDHSRFMNLAEEVARRSNCVRRSVGAVVVRHGQVVSKGWNGLPGSVGNCRDAGCPRCINGGDTGSGYENCLCIHAEQHAIADAARLGVSTEDSTMYVNLRPCMQCLAIAKAAGVRRVFFHGADWKYPDETEAAYSALASQFEAFGCVDVKEQAELAG